MIAPSVFSRTFAVVFRQCVPARPRPQRLSAHQTFDLVQAAGKAGFQHVAPDPTGAIARPDRWLDRVILPGAHARAAFQPGMEARPRSPSASQSHATGQTERCFAMKPNFMSTPSQSRLRPILGCRAPPRSLRPHAGAGRSPAARASFDPCPGNACFGSAPNSFTHLRTTFSWTSMSRDATHAHAPSGPPRS